MVICSNGTFFDISNNNFTITAAAFDYSLSVAPSTVSLCQPSNAEFTVTIGSFNGYVDPVTLSVSGVPAGATSNFSVNPVIPAGTSVLTISNTGNATPGTYTLTVTGNSTSGIKTSTLTLTILDGTPDPITLISPANGATNVALSTVFTWSTYSEPGATYDIEIATDAGFTTIVAQATALASSTYSTSTLTTNTIYYWRVRVNSTCGSSAFAAPSSFTTTGCVIYAASTNLPAAIPTVGTITRTITVPVGGTINDVNVLNLVGTHTRMGDLSFTLTSPQGTVVSLMANVCGTNDNFDLEFDDAAASAVIPCPPTTICEGQTVTLTMNGALNDATNWSVYTASCGGTLVGTTTGTTFTIPNATNQTYYVRGEDGTGCIDEAALTCASIALTTAPVPSAPVASVLDDCGNSVLSASGAGLVWSTGETTSSITVSTAGMYTVSQTIGGCTSPVSTISANPLTVPEITIGALTNPTSCGASDGSILVNGSGVGDITWTGQSTGSATGVTLPYTISSLAGGAYTIGFSDACPSASVTATLISAGAPSAPVVSAVDGCGSSTLTASGTGLVWSTGANTPSITVSTAGTYTVTQTVGGCTSSPAAVTANPFSSLPAPSASVVNTCGSSTLSVVSTGSVLWSTGEATQTIVVTAPGNYTVTESIGGCTSQITSVVATPLAIPSAPIVTVVDKCGMSDLSTSASGTLAWSTSESTPMITVTAPGTYYVSQTVGGCTSAVGAGVANPLTIPAVSFAPLNDVCINTPAFALVGGTPAGGNYSGTAVTGNLFDPSVAGYGVFTIVYTYTDVNGCSASNQQPITVGCAGDEYLQSTLYSLYPNPSSGQLVLETQGIDLERIYIYDAAGKLVYDQLPILENGSCLIDLSELSKGLYTLEILSAGSRSIRERIILSE
ncbi:MAG: T9SS type A sorting domain-containing protein [Cryomorphaceae bacterium]|nr:T9SS type A sorting domain-containing protein [Cryomorphaceae bacterium]